MRQWWKLALIGLLSLGVFVIALLPASFAWQKIQHKVPQLALSNLEGSIWNAKASGAQINQINLDKVALDFRPLNLLRAHIASGFQVEKGQSTVRGEFHQSLSSKYLADMQGEVLIQDIMALVRQYQSVILPLPVQGALAIDMDEIRWHDQFKLDAVDGTVTLSGLHIGGQAVGGEYLFTARTEGDLIVVQVNHAEGADLEIEANATLKADNTYTVKAELAAANSISNKAFNLLKMTGMRSKGQAQTYQFSGKLQQAIR